MTLASFSARERRFSRAGIFIDYVFFGIGLTFVGTGTILPAFVARFTSSPVLIGLVGMLWNGGWTLPQIFAANYFSTIPRKLPLAKVLGWAGRPVFALFALFLVLGVVLSPALTLVLLFASILYFVVLDSIVGVAWFDVLGKALSVRERGALMGISQIFSGLASVGAGLAVRYVLASSGLTFPNEYAVLFLLADAAFMISLGGMYLIREPIEVVEERRPPIREFISGLGVLLRRDAALARVNFSRLLVGLVALASPFFAVYALQTLHLPEATIGIFAVAQTVGSTLAGLVMGWVAGRAGARPVVRIMGGLYLFAPVFAYLSGLSTNGVLQTLLCSLAFLLIGMGDGSIILGFLNYVLEISPSSQRPVYIGLTNTLAGFTILYPFLGGWLAGWMGYRWVFLLAIAGIAVGWMVSWTLPAPHPGTGSPDDGKAAAASNAV